MITYILFKKIGPNAIIPSYQSKGAAGFDFHSIEDFSLEPGQIYAAATGLQCELEEGYEMQIRPRSGLALKGISIVNSPGTIDCDYRGEIKIILCNYLASSVHYFKKGDRIAQGIINKLPIVKIQEVNELTQTKRGDGGFGSTDR